MIDSTVSEIRPLDPGHGQAAERRLDSLTKPRGSLGRLEEFARRLVMIYGGRMPESLIKVIAVFAGDHGVAKEGVSAYPAEVTPQMVMNFLGGGAGINVLSRHTGADVVVVDVGVNHDFNGTEGLFHKKVVMGTKNMALGPAMSGLEAVRSVEAGIEVARDCLSKGYNVIGTGEMGIGNTTPSSAVASVLTGRPVAEVTGRGTGITDDVLKAKVDTIQKAIAVNRPDPTDPMDVLAKVGGAELGAIAGLCLGGAAGGVPVVVDGFISSAGALIAAGLEPGVKEYLFSAHLSVEAGHGAVLDALGLDPIFDLGLRLGEGTGAALAISVIEAGLKIYREMATFDDAGVSTGEERGGA